MWKTSKLFAVSRSRGEKWPNAYASARIQRRLVLVAWRRSTEKHVKKCGPRTDGGSRDPLQERLFEEFLAQEAPVRNANLWAFVLDHNTASKNRSLVREVQDGRSQLGSIMRTLAKTLNVEGKRISNHSTRKSVVAKLKKAGQPRHKIIQITGHANECSLGDYDKVDESERRTLSHTISSSYSTTSTTTRSSETPPSSSSLSVPPTSTVIMLPSSVSPLSSTVAVLPPTYQTSLLSSQMPVSRSANGPAAQHFNNCTVNIQNYFGPQSTNQASSSRVECQISEIPKSPSVSVTKRRRAYIIDSNEDWTYYT